jgi:hypothetical protein
MKQIGKTLCAVILLITAAGTNVALGAITVKLDRDSVAMGDTLRLILTVTEGEEISDDDLRPLVSDFEILQRSTNSNTSIVNGRMSQTRQLIIELTPKREGNLQIPSLHIGQSVTPGIPVVVDAAPDIHSGDQSVVFEAEVDQHSVYVQGQIILTLRVQQAVNLEGRSITELKLENAFVKPLEQHSFQRNIDGRPWLVDEIRYAIFPEQSGTLEIPAQVFSGRASQGRRGFFSFGSGGPLVRRSTQPITIDVLPKPDSFTADTWLPAKRLTLEEKWSTPPDNLHVGESATRSIRIVGEGVQGAQLPPVMFTPIDGLKYYPDQPKISEEENGGGLQGIREDSAAVVPTRAGAFLIPEIRIPWWDTQTKQLQFAVLPAREINVTPAEPSQVLPQGAIPSPTGDNVTATPVSTASASLESNRLWMILSAVSTVGWLVTLLYLWRLRHSRPAEKNAVVDDTSEKRAFKQVLLACAAGNAVAARSAIIKWAAAFDPATAAVSLRQVAAQFGDETFTRQLESLDAGLYSPEAVKWTGDAIADSIRRLRREYKKDTAEEAGQLKLYPGTV